MIYLGDGETDIPSMRIVKTEGGHSVAIYKPGNRNSCAQAKRLVQRGRVNFACPGDYTEGSELYQVITATIAKIKTYSKFNTLSARTKNPCSRDYNSSCLKIGSKSIFEGNN